MLVEDAWLCSRFGQIWRDLGDNDRALPLLEQAVQLGERDGRGRLRHACSGLRC
jgi:hypothetical protein